MKTVTAGGSRRLPRMREAEELLEQAHGYVSKAGDQWGAVDGFDAAAASLQCREIAQLLEECGATPSGTATTQRPDAPQRPGQLLQAAAAALDEIRVSDRAPRLMVARAALAGALLHAPVEDGD